MRLTSLESQIDQVMYFSQGCQLMEEFVYDERTGVKLNNNMIDCKYPLGRCPAGRQEVPGDPLRQCRIWSKRYQPFPANTHLVIIAIHNAIGVWVDPPATPDKVLRLWERHSQDKTKNRIPYQGSGFCGNQHICLVKMKGKCIY